MRIEIPHSLSPEDARKVAQKAAAEYSERYAHYSPQVRWVSQDRAEISVHAKGVTLAGAISLEPGKLVFEADVPFLLRPFAGRAKGAIEGQVEKWLERLKRGEL